MKRVTAILIFALALPLFNCKSEKKEELNTDKTETLDISNKQVFNVVTRSMEFQSIDTIKSGWNTIRYQNLSNETHFILLDKYPEGRTVENTIKEVAPVFEKGMDLINEGKTEEGYAEFNNLPAWFFEVVFSGGTGLIAPKHTAVSTVNLEPGYYIMECYVKMANGKFHTSMGMAKPIIVLDENSGNSPPEATINITLSGGKESLTIKQSLKENRCFRCL